MDVRFGIQSAPHRSAPVSAQRMVNAYLEVAPAGSKSPVAVVPSYGVANFATPGNGPLRGGLTVNGVPYVVSGTQLLSVDAVGVATALGNIPNLDDVVMAGDGTNLVTVTQTNGYILNGGVVTQITDPDFPGASWIGFLDGYFPIIEPNSGRIMVNETPYIPADWNALDFATAEAVPDDLIWGLITQREFLAFGKESSEMFYNSGNSDFPLDRVSSGFFEIGIMSPWAAGKLGNVPFFLGHDGVAYMLNGYVPQRISEHPFEQAVEGYADKSCRVITWKEGGHGMVGFRFATAMWIYDLATQLWHDRLSHGRTSWRGKFVLEAFKGYLIADDGTHKLGKLTPDLFTEWGSVLRTECTSAEIGDENATEHDMLDLIFETGVGNALSADPQVMLIFSDDGGRKWSSEQTRKLGKIGETQARVRFTRLGRPKGKRLYQYAITDQARRTLIAARLNDWR